MTTFSSPVVFAGYHYILFVYVRLFMFALSIFIKALGMFTISRRFCKQHPRRVPAPSLPPAMVGALFHFSQSIVLIGTCQCAPGKPLLPKCLSLYRDELNDVEWEHCYVLSRFIFFDALSAPPHLNK